MQHGHWKEEHPELPLEEFGFVLLGCLPSTDAEAFNINKKKLIQKSNILNKLQSRDIKSSAALNTTRSTSKNNTRKQKRPAPCSKLENSIT